MSQGSQPRSTSTALQQFGMSVSKHDRQPACAPSGLSRGWACTVGTASPPRLAELSFGGESNSAPGATKTEHKCHIILYQETKILFGKTNRECGLLHQDGQPWLQV